MIGIDFNNFENGVTDLLLQKKFPTKKNLYTKENSRNLQSNQKITNHINISNQKSEFGLTFKYRLGADTTDQIYKNMD